MKTKLLTALIVIKGVLLVMYVVLSFNTEAPEAKGVSKTSMDSLSTPCLDRLLEKEKTLLEAIKAREQELDKRAEKIAEKERRLEELKDMVKKELARFAKTRAEVVAMLEKIQVERDKNFMRIVKIYESMPPEKASQRLEKLDEEMAVKIIAAMKEKKAGKILANLSVDKSVRISMLMNKKLKD